MGILTKVDSNDDQKFVGMKFNSHDDLPLEKTLKTYNGNGNGCQISFLEGLCYTIHKFSKLNV